MSGSNRKEQTAAALGGSARALLLDGLDPFDHFIPHESVQAKIGLALDLQEFHAGVVAQGQH
jgi:hypothetical protein